MRHLSISLAWDETRAILARDGRLMAAVALALIVLPQTILGVVGLPFGTQASLLSRIVYILAVLIGFAGQIALNRLAIGPSTTVGTAIARGFARLLPLVVALAIFGLVLLVLVMIVAFGLAAGGAITPNSAEQTPPPALVLFLVLCTVLGSAIIQLTIPVAAAEAGGPIHLLSRSWRLGKGAYLRLLAFVIVIFVGIALIVLAGQFVLGSAVLALLGPPSAGSVSALVLSLIMATIQAALTVVTAVMLARIYLQLAGRSESDSGLPITGI